MILQSYAVSSENISKSIKIKTENGFYLKANVGIFRRNADRPEKIVALPIFICNEQKRRQIPAARWSLSMLLFSYYTDKSPQYRKSKTNTV